MKNTATNGVSRVLPWHSRGAATDERKMPSDVGAVDRACMSAEVATVIREVIVPALLARLLADYDQVDSRATAA